MAILGREPGYVLCSLTGCRVLCLDRSHGYVRTHQLSSSVRVVFCTGRSRKNGSNTFTADREDLQAGRADQIVGVWLESGVERESPTSSVRRRTGALDSKCPTLSVNVSNNETSRSRSRDVDVVAKVLACLARRET